MAFAQYSDGAELNPDAGCWQPPPNVIPTSPMSPAMATNCKCDTQAGGFSPSNNDWQQRSAHPQCFNSGTVPTTAMLELSPSKGLSEQERGLHEHVVKVGRPTTRPSSDTHLCCAHLGAIIQLMTDSQTPKLFVPNPQTDVLLTTSDLLHIAGAKRGAGSQDRTFTQPQLNRGVLLSASAAEMCAHVIGAQPRIHTAGGCVGCSGSVWPSH